jgi:hypothetical protein
MNIKFLKELNLDRVIELEEAIAVSADLRTLSVEYDELGIDRPEWITSATNIVREEIARRTRAQDLAQMRDLQAKMDSLKTLDEKRSEVGDALAALQRKLGLMGPAPTAPRRKAVAR